MQRAVCFTWHDYSNACINVFNTMVHIPNKAISIHPCPTYIYNVALFLVFRDIQIVSLADENTIVITFASIAKSTLNNESVNWNSRSPSMLKTWGFHPKISLHWRHNEPDGVSNHQPRDCLLNCLFRYRSRKTSKRVTGLCVENSSWTVNSPHKRRVTRKMFPFDDVIMYHDLTICLYRI